MVQGFSGATQVGLPLACTYDFEVSSAKYLHALRDGTVPLQFLFSGTAFVQGPRGFSVQQIPWDREDRYDMPVAVWREVIAAHFPNSGWLRLDCDTVDALAAYRRTHGLLSQDEAILSLLARAGQDAR